MGALADAAFSSTGLERAWDDVLRNDSQDSQRSRSVANFARRMPGRLEYIAGQLAEGCYRPGWLTECVLRMPGGNRRTLHIPSVQDRIVARAILDAATPVIDPLLGPASYAYRPGLGVDDAVQAVAALREEGLSWALRSDVRDCFPSIPTSVAVGRFAGAVRDDELTEVVRQLTRRRVRGGRRSSIRGLPQGCPLSPVLANLVLVDLDLALADAGFPLVRYSDDFVILAEDQGQLADALTIMEKVLGEHGMAVSEEKTEIMSFEEGFAFLGEEFGPRYPALLANHRIPEPEDRVVYAAVPGGRLRLARGRLLVDDQDDKELLSAPCSQVSRIVAFGPTGVSAGLRTWALREGIDVVIASRRGSYLGTMSGDHAHVRAPRLMAQCAAVDSPLALETARAIVDSKIDKQITLLQRFNRRHAVAEVRTAITSMQLTHVKVPTADTTEELMGLEGASAAAYFPAYGMLFPEGLRFSRRSRQPPLDVANAALSYLYTILLGECVTALRSAGLEPSLGLLHSSQLTRPSLALDLMEEFRPMVVDQVVLFAASQKRLTPEAGRLEADRAGVLLQQDALGAIIDAYERRMLTVTSGAAPGFTGSIRRHVYHQAHQLRATVMGEGPWRGLTWR